MAPTNTSFTTQAQMPQSGHSQSEVSNSATRRSQYPNNHWMISKVSIPTFSRSTGFSTMLFTKKNLIVFCFMVLCTSATDSQPETHQEKVNGVLPTLKWLGRKVCNGGRNTVKYGSKGLASCTKPLVGLHNWAKSLKGCSDAEATGASLVGIPAGLVALPFAVAGAPFRGANALAKKCGAKKGTLKIAPNSAPRPEWMKGKYVPNPKKHIKRAGRAFMSLCRGDTRKLPAGWTAERDESGKRFWKNGSTGETVFEKPVKPSRRLRLLASAKRAGATSIADHLLHQ